MATKVMIENAVLLTAEIRAEKAQDKDGKWIDTGGKKLELTVFSDAFKDDLSSGKVRTLTSAKNCNYNLDDVLAKLHRYDMLTIVCNLVEYKDRNAFTIASIMDKDGTVLTTALTETNEPLPF